MVSGHADPSIDRIISPGFSRYWDFMMSIQLNFGQTRFRDWWRLNSSLWHWREWLRNIGHDFFSRAILKVKKFQCGIQAHGTEFAWWLWRFKLLEFGPSNIYAMLLVGFPVNQTTHSTYLILNFPGRLPTKLNVLRSISPLPFPG